MKRLFDKSDYLITLVTFCICIIGLFLVKESSLIWARYLYNNELYFFSRQLIFFFVGIIFFYLGYSISFKFLYKYSIYILLLSYLLLILTIVPGIGLTKNGSTSWLGYKSLSFQPSELFKIGIILINAKYLQITYYKSNKIKVIYLPLLLLGIGIFLIMLQPDLGSCLVIVSSVIIQLFVSKLPFKIFIITLIVLLFGVVILILSASYRMNRIFAFIDPFKDPLGSGFQIIQSLFAIGPGGIIGQGFNTSIQRYFYLPEPQTDFIFAIYIEEFGLLGGAILISLYFLLFYLIYQKTIHQKNIFKAYVNIGFLGLLFVQVFINLGVVIGLLPVTGITLPLISYGGSSLILSLFSIGLILSKRGEETNEDLTCRIK
ncbi:MAG: FtsW/RodA/SpoVE family cell cycle protein [Bacillales bacterium]|nr:FtsW/RodA/SpoVE family cell cycle protein [Bacillales bacterium]